MQNTIPFFDKEEKINYSQEHTRFLLDILKKFAIEAKNKKYIISGGIAIDLTYGEIRRPHEDLDIYPDEEDVQFWQQWFISQGLKVVTTPDTKNYPNAFVVLDQDFTYVADIYGVTFEENGDLRLLWQEDNYKKYSKWDEKNSNNSRKIIFEGVEIQVEDYKEVIAQKKNHAKRTGETLNSKHLFDIETAKLINENEKLSTFKFNGTLLQTHFEESNEVVAGVTCDVYSHPETSDQDLGIITIQPGKKTPLQKVLKGERTIEGYLSGKGTLTITHTDGSHSVFEVSSETKDFMYEVQISEHMQWKAAPDSELQVFEICFPPYQDSRFKNIE